MPPKFYDFFKRVFRFSKDCSCPNIDCGDDPLRLRHHIAYSRDLLYIFVCSTRIISPPEIDMINLLIYFPTISYTRCVKGSKEQQVEPGRRHVGGCENQVGGPEDTFGSLLRCTLPNMTHQGKLF